MAEPFKLRLEPCKTTISITETPVVFDALHDPRITWNGFLVPHFPLSEARRVVEWINETYRDAVRDGIGDDQTEARWFGDRVALLNHQYAPAGTTWANVTAGVVMDDNATPPEWLEVYTPDKWGLYCIGGMSWTWECWDDVCLITASCPDCDDGDMRCERIAPHSGWHMLGVHRWDGGENDPVERIEHI